MTTHALHITFEAKEGALMRIIGVIQRRGFETVGIDMPHEVEEGCRHALVRVEARAANFNAEILRLQVERLIEVREVKIVEKTENAGKR
jgi:acetolactate synthase regulatory subunit